MIAGIDLGAAVRRVRMTRVMRWDAMDGQLRLMDGEAPSGMVLSYDAETGGFDLHQDGKFLGKSVDPNWCRELAERRLSTLWAMKG